MGYDYSRISKIKCFLFDMDGTIYEDEYLFEGTKPLLETIVAKGARYIFITNNSSRSVLDYVAKLKRLGIETDKDHFFTSSQATILLLKEKYPNVKVYCQGTRSLIKELEEAGIDVTEEASDDVGLVLTGFDTELNFTKLTNTCFLLGRDLL